MKSLWVILLVVGSVPLFAQYTLEHRYNVTDGLYMTESQYTAYDGKYLWILSTSGVLSRFDGLNFKDYEEEVGFREILRSVARDGKLVYSQAQTTNGLARKLRLHRMGEIIRLPGLPEEGALAVADTRDGVDLRFLSKDSLWIYDNESLRLLKKQVLPIRLDTIPYIIGSFVAENRELIAIYKANRLHQWDKMYAYVLSGPRLGMRLPAASLSLKPANVVPEFKWWPAVFVLHKRVFSDTLVLMHKDLGLPPAGREIFYPYLNPPYYGQERTPAEPGEMVDLNFWPLSIQPFRLLEEPVRCQGQSAYATNLEGTPDGSLWLADHGGLRRLFPAVQTFRSGSGEMVSALHAIIERPNGEIWFGGYGTGFARYDGQELARTSMRDLPPTLKVMPGAYGDTTGNLYFFADDGHRFMHVRSSGNVSEYSIKAYTGYRFSGYHIRQAALPATAPISRTAGNRSGNQDVLVAGLSSFRTEDEKKKYGALAIIELGPQGGIRDYHIVDHRKGVRITNVLTTTSDPEGRIWFAHSRTGLGVYNPVRDTVHCAQARQGAEFGAIAMAFDQRGTLWMGTLKGLAYLEHAADLPFDQIPNLIDQVEYITLDALPANANRVLSLTIHHDSLFFGHQNGLGILDLETFYQSDRQDFPCYSFNTMVHGMGSAEQNAIRFDIRGKLWLGTDEGALRFDVDRLLSQRRPPVLKNTLITGDQDTLVQADSTTYVIPAKDRSLEFGYDLYNFDLFQGDALVHVLLANEKGDTILYRQNLEPRQMERVKYLLPGTYQLTYILRYDNHTVEERVLSINVPKTFWEKPLNWLLTSMLILSPLLVFLYAQMRLAKKDATLQKTLKKQEALQVMALVGTINPHFITNSLQWVQSAIRQKKDPGAINRIVGSLGDNIRTVFNLAYERKAGHTLADELTLVKKYLDSVSLLTANRYDFQLPDASQIARLGHYQVILLELQVHVENAVEHGLRNRANARGIKISLKDDEHYLYLSIEDDGGGITRARQSPGIGSRKGRQMLDDLHQIFNRRNVRKISTRFESDLYVEPGNADLRYGTRVTITVPKIYNYDLESTSS